MPKLDNWPNLDRLWSILVKPIEKRENGISIKLKKKN
jgi:hypothetical protein